MSTRQDQAPATPTPTVLLGVTLLLWLLLAAAVGVSLLPEGWWRPVLAMTVAGAKALLIILYFMRARFEKGNLALFIAGGWVWLIILFTLTFADYLTR